jgi:hypothetical protein
MIQHSSGDYIAIYEGNRIRVVLLLRPQVMHPILTDLIKPILKEFSDRFESKYRKELKAYEQFTGKFVVEDIFNETFSLDMGMPHITKYRGFMPEDRLEEYVFQAADKFCKIVGYFYLENLLYLTKQHVIDEARNIVMTNPEKARKEKIDPDHIDFPPDDAFFIGMFNLRKLGLLAPIQLKEINSYSKIKYPKIPM